MLPEAPEKPWGGLSVPPLIVMNPLLSVTVPAPPAALVTVSWLLPISRSAVLLPIDSAPIVSLTYKVTSAGREMFAVSALVLGGPPLGVQSAAVDQLPDTAAFQENARSATRNR